jgi:hypothetical protein
MGLISNLRQQRQLFRVQLQEAAVGSINSDAAALSTESSVNLIGVFGSSGANCNAAMQVINKRVKPRILCMVLITTTESKQQN